MIIDEPETITTQSSTDKRLVSFVTERVSEWEDHRDTNYRDKWAEYNRLWRGQFAESDKTRASERSKLISPALQQAIEMAVAELEEASFGKKVWFDFDDDVPDQQKADIRPLRDLLLEDMENARFSNEISKIYLNGALYGTGIGKLLIEEKPELVIKQEQQAAQLGVNSPSVERKEYICVKLEAVEPNNFVIDPTARTIEEAMGVAHVVNRPRHVIKAKQESGEYNEVSLGTFMDDNQDLNLDSANNNADKVKIIEYYGLVPRGLLPVLLSQDEELVDLSEDLGEDSPDFDEDDLIEAIVVIANDSYLLRAVENPYLMRDRPFVAFQYDTIPNKFWGRGVAEKGYNAQKALDAELRTRIDAMALSAHPMLAVDAGMMNTRGANLQISPGKVFLTNGNPANSVMPLQLPGPNPSTFHQSGDLERMVQMGTGSMDTAAPVNIVARNQTASGMSMMQAGMLRRSKRTMRNISDNFLGPVIKKTYHRYIQFRPERYPAIDVTFKVVATLGIMAREYEQAQLTQLLSIVPPDSPAFKLLLKGIFDNSSLENKAELMQAVEQMMQPPSEEQQQQMQQMQMIQMQTLIKGVEKLQSEITKNYADAQAKTGKIALDHEDNVTNRINAITNAKKTNVRPN